MDGSVVQTWMSDILHAITQGLLVPDILLLVLFIGYALFCIGSIIAEYFTERRHFQVTMPKFLAALMAAEEDGIPPVIEESGLLKRQKIALLTVYDYRMLPGDALIALIKRLVSEEESRYDRISGRNNMAARVSPMLGLMGTLIPLGPGIQALGEANTEMLSASLLIAFDTTVAGLVVAAVCMIVGKIRSVWYSNYMSALDSAMATMLQKIEDMRAEGKIVVQEPSDYAFLFEQAAGNGVKAGFAERNKEAEGAEGKKETPSGQSSASASYATPLSAGAQTASSASSFTSQARPQDASSPAAAATSAASAPVAFGDSSLPIYPANATSAQAGSSSSVGGAASAPSTSDAAQSGLSAAAQPGQASAFAASYGSAATSDTSVAGASYGASSTDRFAGVASYPTSGYVGSYAATDPSADAASSFGAAAASQQAAASTEGTAHPLQTAAPFSPVPDPAFITDLAAAAQAGGADAAQAQEQAQTQAQPQAQPQAAYPADAAAQGAHAKPAAQTSGWYRPQLRSDDSSSSSTTEGR